MIEGIIVFILGFVCGMYKDEIKKFFDDKFKNNDNDKNQIICS